MTEQAWIPVTGTPRVAPAVRTAASRDRRRYTVAVHGTLDGVEASWRALERGGCCTVFQSFEVFAAWARHIAPARARSWHVVTVSDAGHGSIVMILPLCLREAGGLKVIEGADLEVSDFIAPVIAEEFKPARGEMRELWAQIRGLLPPADVIRISKMPAMLGGVPNPLLKTGSVLPFHLSNFKTRLDTGQPPWFERIPAKVRDDLATRRRKLGKRGALEFKTAATAAEADRFFEAMVTQRAERCRAMGRDNILDDISYRRFYRELVRPDAAANAGVMQALLIDNEIIATGYGFRHGSDFLMIFPTFVAAKWRNYSPGLQFFAESMRWAAGQGFTSYDFTIGAEGFKRDFAAEAEPLFEHLSAASWRGWPAVADGRLRCRVRQVRERVQRGR